VHSRKVAERQRGTYTAVMTSTLKHKAWGSSTRDICRQRANGIGVGRSSGSGSSAAARIFSLFFSFLLSFRLFVSGTYNAGVGVVARSPSPISGIGGDKMPALSICPNASSKRPFGAPVVSPQRAESSETPGRCCALGTPRPADGPAIEW
jgi:hypothetical protein